MSKSSLVQRFTELFRGLSRAYGVYKVTVREAGGKMTGPRHTAQGTVTQALWEEHLAGGQGLGIVPINDDNMCWFGAIDIDVYGIDIKELEIKCRDLNLPLVPTRTKSAGAHLYLFCKEAIPASVVRARLEEFAIRLGHGGCEIFPKQAQLLSKEDVGNWINMPYHGILGPNGKTERYGIFKGQELTFKGYIDQATKFQVTQAQLEAVTFQDGGTGFDDGPPCLQSMSAAGIASGMRNDTLFAIVVYLKKKFADDWENHVQEYNQLYCKPPVSADEVKGIIKSNKRKDYGYTCTKQPLLRYCNKPVCVTRSFGVGQIGSWGIIFGKDAVKILTDPPVWYVSINGVRVKLTAQHLRSQRLFGDVCVERINFSPTNISAGRFAAEINAMLATAEQVAAPPEASPNGELMFHLRMYCTSFTQAETREELITGKPYTEDGLTYFQPAGFKKYLDTHNFRSIKDAGVYTTLKEAGLQYRQMKIGKSNVHVWMMPEFKEDQDPDPIPPRKPNGQGEM